MHSFSTWKHILKQNFTFSIEINVTTAFVQIHICRHEQVSYSRNVDLRGDQYSWNLEAVFCRQIHVPRQLNLRLSYYLKLYFWYLINFPIRTHCFDFPSVGAQFFSSTHLVILSNLHTLKSFAYYCTYTPSTQIKSILSTLIVCAENNSFCGWSIVCKICEDEVKNFRNLKQKLAITAMFQLLPRTGNLHDHFVKVLAVCAAKKYGKSQKNIQ